MATGACSSRGFRSGVTDARVQGGFSVLGYFTLGDRRVAGAQPHHSNVDVGT